MPWVKQELCVGCGICIKDCPVKAIIPNSEGKAEIIDDKCIRCGSCHSVCPQNAVRHDSERIPLDVDANIDKVNKMLEHFKSSKEKEQFFERITRHYNKEIKISKLTIDKISEMKEHL